MRNVFRQIFFSFIVVSITLGFGRCSFAIEKSLIYKSYSEKTGEIVQKSYVTIKDFVEGEKELRQTVESPEGIIKSEFILDEQNMVSEWRVSSADEAINYKGRKEWHTLFIDGTFNGNLIDKVVNLDDKPFFDFPEFNLKFFVLSEQRNVYFWMLRKDRLIKRLMYAKKRGEETLLINGKKMDVIKVYYSEAGMREKHYKAFLYFRKSDGLFVKKTVSTGLTTDLINERSLGGSVL